MITQLADWPRILKVIGGYPPTIWDYQYSSNQLIVWMSFQRNLTRLDWRFRSHEDGLDSKYIL